MSILQSAAPAAPEPLIVTICGTPGSGKTSLAATFPKPFLIRTQGEAVPRDLSGDERPDELGETDSVGMLWDQLKALAMEDHAYKTVIIDSVTGLENLFIADVLASDAKARGIQQALGGYGAGRDAVAAQHMRVRRAAEAIRRRGIHVVFLAHSDINRIDPPDSDGYTAWGLRLHSKSQGSYVDSVDVVGFLKQAVILRGEEGQKKAVTTDDRVLVTYLTPANISKNRLGITEDIEVQKGVNPLAEYLRRRRKAAPKVVDEQSAEETTDQDETENA